MQDINLLQSKLKDRTVSWDRKNSLIIGVLMAVLLAVLGYGGVLVYLNSSTKTETAKLRAENTSIKAKLDSNQGELADAKGFQAQLQNIEQLTRTHVYWSGIFNLVQDTVLKRSEYDLVTMKTDGRVHVEGLTDTFTNLGKLILSLSSNPDVHDVHLLSAQRSSGQKAGYTFSLDYSINQALLIKK